MFANDERVAENAFFSLSSTGKNIVLIVSFTAKDMKQLTKEI